MQLAEPQNHVLVFWKDCLVSAKGLSPSGIPDVLLSNQQLQQRCESSGRQGVMFCGFLKAASKTVCRTDVGVLLILSYVVGTCWGVWVGV